MRIELKPSTLAGTVQAVASKSHAHRLLIATALSDAPSEVSIHTTSQDIDATKDCLAQLHEEAPVFHCCESGSTLRFLIPVAMALKEKATFLGSGRLPQRPISPLKEEMEAHGCRFTKGPSESEICTIQGKLQSGTFTLPGNISSQYITGLLFALPLLDGDSKICITSPLESSKYVDMTLDVLRAFQIQVRIDNNDGCPTYTIKGKQSYRAPKRVTAEGDWSNIAFWVIAGILSKGQGITCQGLRSESIQGDKAIAKLAAKMGGKIVQSAQTLVAASDQLTAIDIDASEIPDLVPILSVAAATANGTTRIYNAGRLRIKESDRLSAMCDCLSKVGANIIEESEGLIIHGVPKLKGGTVSGYNDHRIVMAMSIASIISENPIIIEGAEAINKSYPTFFGDFKALGGDCCEI